MRLKPEIRQMVHTLCQSNLRDLLPCQAILTWCRAQCTTERGEEQKEAVSEIFNAIIILPKPPTFFSHHHYHSPLSRCEWVRFFLSPSSSSPKNYPPSPPHHHPNLYMSIYCIQIVFLIRQFGIYKVRARLSKFLEYIKWENMSGKEKTF